MNGRFFPLLPSFRTLRKLDATTMAASASKRLSVALAISCLLHAALFVLPYLGVSASVSRPALPGVNKAEPARALGARLALEDGSAFTNPGVSAKGERAVESPAEQARPAPDPTQGIGVLPIPAPAYYSTDQLSKRPQPTAPAELDVPEIRPIIAAGTVILKLWINELGYVVSVDVEKSDLPEIFSETAVAAFRSLRFTPGELNGRRVGAVMRIQVTYEDSRIPPP